MKFHGSCLEQEKVIFTRRNVANFFIVYEFAMWLKDLNTVFALGICLFGAANLT